MKRKWFFVGICFILIVAFYFVAREIFPSSSVKLDAPKDISVSGYVLDWTGDYYAVCYEIRVGDRVERTEKSQINLKYSDHGKRVTIQAIGDGKWRMDSDVSDAITVYFDGSVENKNFVYYNVDELELTYKEFNFEETPVSVAPFDSEPFGYEFLYWYRNEGGLERIEREDFTFSGNVTLYAKLREIEYPVSFATGVSIDNAPTTYTVSEIEKIKSVSTTIDGYYISDWLINSSSGEKLSTTTMVVGELTLYPVFSLVTEGLEFTSCEGGYAVSGCKGNYQSIVVPKQYEGLPVVRVNENAFTFGEELVAQSVIFCGDIVLESGSFRSISSSLNITFMGDAEVKSNAFTIGGNISPIQVNFVFQGEPNVEVAFFSYYLGINTHVEVVVGVGEEFILQIKEIVGDTATVQAI